MKIKHKKTSVIMGLIIFCITFCVMWYKVHPTYYKYNDGRDLFSCYNLAQKGEKSISGRGF